MRSILGLAINLVFAPGTFSTPILVNDRGLHSNEILADAKLAARSTDTCADPSLARVVYQGFSPSVTAHSLNFLSSFVTADSISTDPLLWVIQGAGVFRAWQTQQPFTVPLFRLGNPSGAGGSVDYVFMVGVDAKTPPTLAGYQTDANDIVAWVYNSPVCGSVPLMSAVLSSRTDHSYTADPAEHADMLNMGWADSGSTAYVLPVSA